MFRRTLEIAPRSGEYLVATPKIVVQVRDGNRLQTLLLLEGSVLYPEP